MIRYCFNNSFHEVAIDSLVSSRTLPTNVMISTKYKQIVMSIREIGLIEPIVIYIESADVVKILDGHLRVNALKELGIASAHCLISPVNDTYTYNKRVNRLTIIQEQKMLKKAIGSGVSIDKLGIVLGVTADTLNRKINLSKGIAPEVIALLSEKQVSVSLFDTLRKMIFARQIEVVSIMINLNNFTKQFALSMLHTTSRENLIDAHKGSVEKKDIRKNIERLEREMMAVRVETEQIEDEYSQNNLQLVIVKSYIKKLLDNSAVLHWLIDNNSEYLTELKKIAGVNSISQ